MGTLELTLILREYHHTTETIEKEQITMKHSLLIPGIGLGLAAGALMGIKLKSNERQVKRTMKKAKNNMENLFDSIGL